MTDYGYLIHLLYCAVHNLTPEEKPDGVSFESVLKLGKLHEVANIAFLSVERLENKPSPEVYGDWQLYYFFSVQRDSRQRLAYGQMLDELHSAGIRTLEAQGTVTKTLYPSPELRMMSDIDFIIDSENLDKALEITERLGYESDLTDFEKGEFAAKLDDIYIEFHTDFFKEQMYNREERFCKAVNLPFTHAAPKSDDAYSYVLDDTYFYLYSVLHIIKHFETTGCGIRRILDLYYLKKAYAGKTDEALVNGIIDGFDFRKNYDLLLALEEKWFENGNPEVDLAETERDVILSGNHGVYEIFVRNNVRKDKKEGVKFSKLKRIFKFIFPDKEYIYIQYPQCRERNYSAFRCQLYRIVMKLRDFKFSHAIYHIKTVLRSK